jgi:hypothetical protein
VPSLSVRLRPTLLSFPIAPSNLINFRLFTRFINGKCGYPKKEKITSALSCAAIAASINISLSCISQGVACGCTPLILLIQALLVGDSFLGLPFCN